MLACKMAHIVHDDKTQNLTLLLCNLQLLLHDILMYDIDIKFKIECCKHQLLNTAANLKLYVYVLFYV